MSDKFLPDPVVNLRTGEAVPAIYAGGDFAGLEVQERGFDLREFSRLLYKYRWIIGGSTLLFTALSVLYVSLVTPQYTASVTMRIGSYQPVLIANQSEDFYAEGSKGTEYFETQMKEVKSYSLADRVLKNEVLRAKLFPTEKPGLIGRFFGVSSRDESADQSIANGSYSNSVRRLNAYLSMIDISPIRKTSLATLSATTADPRLSAELANMHAQAYIDWVRATRIEQQSAGIKFLKSQELELKEKILDLEREIAEYAEAHSIVAVNKDENITSQRMSQLNKLLTDSTEKRLEAENVYKEAEQALQAKGGAAAFDDSSVENLRSRLAELEAEYGNLSAKFMPGYPKMQQLKAQIDNLRQSIQAQRKQIVLGLRAKAEALLQKEEMLKEELDKQKSAAFELSRSQAQFDILNRELESSRELLQSVLKQMKETGLAAQSNSSNVAIVDPASIPHVRSYPRKKLMIFIGLILGLGLGLAMALLLNYLDNTIRTPEQVSELLGVPSLGVVPSFSEDTATSPPLRLSEGLAKASQSSLLSSAGSLNGQGEGAGEEANLPVIYLNSPRSLASEAYRTIRTAMLLSQAGEPPRRILISSAQSSEGKTTSTVNLAATLASAGAKVVILDADLRRPSVFKFFKIDRHAPGLVEVVTGQRSIAEVIVENRVKRISVVPSGEIPPNPAELLGSLEMVAVIDELARLFDYVLIDSPPVLPVTDSVILSRYVDGVLVVVKGASTPRKVVKDAIARLRGVGARLLGVVLNDVDVAGGDYYYYNRYYTSYYRETEEKMVGGQSR